jgi:uncharacterized phage infection (PIP) family protein YhgE
MSFDRMRSMLMRAAEIRDSEQQQIFDALDEIHARLSPLESIGSVRKRLSELPDRTETSVLAERLDETLGKLEAQDAALAAAHRSVDSLVDRLAKPFAELGGRLDGMGGRFEGVAGRMDGLEDRIAGLHKRLDDLDHHLDKHDNRLDSLPTAVQGPLRERVDALELGLRSRLDEVDEGMHEHLDGTREATQRSMADSADGLRKVLDETRDGLTSTAVAHRDELRGALTDVTSSTHGMLDSLAARPAVDPNAKLDALADRLEQLTSTLDSITSRLDTVEDGFTAKLKTLGSGVEQQLSRLDSELTNRPDTASIGSLIKDAHAVSERRHAGHLDEAMATFAELILGGGPAGASPPPPPRPAQRRTRGKPASAKQTRDDQESPPEPETPEEG